jgi:hypothetical protein
LQRGAGCSFITTSATTGGHEARTPRHSGPRLLLIAAAEPLPPPGPLHRHNHIGKTQTQDAVIGPVCRRSKRAENLPENRRRCDNAHDVDDLAFVLLELMAVIGGVAVFLGLVMDVDLPVFAISQGNNRPDGPPPSPAACRRRWSMRRPGRTPAPCTPAPRRDRIRVVADSMVPRAQPCQFMR